MLSRAFNLRFFLWVMLVLLVIACSSIDRFLPRFKVHVLSIVDGAGD